MKNTILFFIIAFLAINPLSADLSNVFVDQGLLKYKSGDFLNAKFLFKKALKMNPDNAIAWEHYDNAIIKLDALVKRTKNLVLVPKFDIKYDEIKMTDISRFKQRYIKISGRIKNMSDLGFEKIVVKLILLKNERRIKTLDYIIENLTPGSQRTFSFNKLVPAFTSYEIKPKVMKER
ncbi:hypothetical protein KAJ27_12885 [bacterium]|nr:hypothetical protein [bacterium]